MSISLPLAMKGVVNTHATNVLLYGGRLGGKSNGSAILAALTMLEKPYTDGIVARVSYGSMADSSYAEMEAAIEALGDDVASQFDFRKSPLRMVRKGNAGTIYFVGYGGSNTSRTKSIRTKHPISFVIFEETQELKDKRNLDEALASFRRRFGEGVKVLLLGNPPPMQAHWFNLFVEEKKGDPDWLVKKMTYLDILPFVNDYDLREITKAKLADYDYYNWFYMGEPSGGYGSVYPMFRRERHVITALDWERVKERSRIRPVGMVVGGDGAVTRDSTAFVPIILLSNGQSVVGPIFVHDPRKSGAMGYHQLVQDHLVRWMEEVCQRFRLGSPKEVREGRYRGQPLPIWMRIDSAAPDLIQECRFHFGDRCDVGPIRKSSVMEMTGVAQSAIANDNAIVIDYGGTFDYVSNRFEKGDNILARQLSLLVWNERQTGYDPAVPNDVSDAWTYGNLFWYGNQENIQHFNILKARNMQTEMIGDILKNKEIQRWQQGN